MDANNDKKNGSLITIRKNMSARVFYPPFDNKYDAIKKINRQIKDFIKVYGCNCPDLGYNIVIDLYIFPTYIQVFIDLYNNNVKTTVYAKISIESNYKLLLEILEDLTDEKNDKSIVQKLNRLVFTYKDECSYKYKEYIVKIIENTAINNHEISPGKYEYHKYSITLVEADS